MFAVHHLLPDAPQLVAVRASLGLTAAFVAAGGSVAADGLSVPPDVASEPATGG
jgi:hypothetical protein